MEMTQRDCLTVARTMHNGRTMAVVLMATRGTPLPQLRVLRIGALLTQDDLAAKARVSRNTVARIENDGKPAELSTVRKLADALGVTPAELMRAAD